MPMALAGCGSGSKTPSNSAADKDKDKPFLSGKVNSGAITITARNDKGMVSWVARAAGSTTDIGPDGTATSDLQTVNGDLYKDGQIVSHFTSNTAHAAQAKRELQLAGNVTVAGLKSGVTLKSDKVRWMDDKKLVAAEGNVSFESNVWTLGPFPVQWCTPDMSDIGSPDQFK